MRCTCNRAWTRQCENALRRVDYCTLPGQYLRSCYLYTGSCININLPTAVDLYFFAPFEMYLVALIGGYRNLSLFQPNSIPAII